jgi:hypothetical protein
MTGVIAAKRSLVANCIGLGVFNAEEWSKVEAKTSGL